MLKRVAILSIILLLSSFTSAKASTFRCGTEIVRTGDLTAEVLMKCGKPDYAEEAASITTGSISKRRSMGEEGRRRKGRTYAESSVRVEHWYYDRGFNDFVYVLTFIGGRLANVKTVGYGGKGEWGDMWEQSYAPPSEEETMTSPAEPPGEQNEAPFEEKLAGRIDLVGSPYGANVYLDDYYTGNIPCTIEEVREGGHNLLVSYSGYKDWKERVLVKEGVTLWLAVHLEREGLDEEDVGAGESEAHSGKKLYKWTDETGRIHITDHPPPEVHSP
jgi:hypothetical protein